MSVWVQYPVDQTRKALVDRVVNSEGPIPATADGSTILRLSLVKLLYSMLYSMLIQCCIAALRIERHECCVLVLRNSSV